MKLEPQVMFIALSQALTSKKSVVVLTEATNKNTGLKENVVCLFFDGKLTPIAQMLEGDPSELFEPITINVKR